MKGRGFQAERIASAKALRYKMFLAQLKTTKASVAGAERAGIVDTV